MIARRAIAPLHHPLNHCAIIGGALRRVLVDHITGAYHTIPGVHQRTVHLCAVLEGTAPCKGVRSAE